MALELKSTLIEIAKKIGITNLNGNTIKKFNLLSFWSFIQMVMLQKRFSI